MSDEDKVVSLDRFRALKEFDEEASLVYVEALCGERGGYAIHAAIRDLEAMAYGKEDPSKPLRQPETVYEAEVLVRTIRFVANCLAREAGLEHMIRPEDDEPAAKS